MNKYSIRKELHIAASRERVFDALTHSAEIVKYYPLLEVVSDWTLGAEVLYKGEVDGVGFTDFGVITTLERPSSYGYAYWSDNHGTDRSPENQQTILYSLTDSGNSTLLQLQHDNIHSAEQHQLMNDTVWDYLLDSLKSYVEAAVA